VPRVLPASLAALLVTALAACDAGGAGDADLASDDGAVCSLVERLDRTGEAVAQADVNDPGGFDAALADAVEEYRAVLDELRDVAPDELQDDIDTLDAAVQQYRFGDGVDARAALDAYAQTSCA
jgi:hypothetical protein